MISKETQTKIVRLHYAEHWKITTIARQVGVHHGTVRRVLQNHGVELEAVMSRPCMVDPYRDFIRETLETYPKLPASRLFEMVRERGYPGGPDHFRTIVAQYRPKKSAEAFVRRKTLPGEEAQVDWGHFGTLEVPGGKRPLYAFVMVLSHSRHVFLRFSLDMKGSTFLEAHQLGFEDFGGVPRVLLYDNLKSVVLERKGDIVRFNPQILDFAKHHRFDPRPCNIARGNEKGRVERAIRYIRTSFIPARTWKNLDDLNAQASHWCDTVADRRKWHQDRTQTVKEAFLDERSRLIALSETACSVEDRRSVSVGKVPYARFDSNEYSVPHDRARRRLTLLSTPKRIRLLDGAEIVAVHERSWGKGQTIENPAHIEGLLEAKRRARRHQGMDRLCAAVPSARALLEAAAQHGHNLGAAVSALLRLLDSHDSDLVEAAVVEALGAGVVHAAGVRQVLESQTFSDPPAVGLHLSATSMAKDPDVRPHNLSGYTVEGKE